MIREPVAGSTAETLTDLPGRETGHGARPMLSIIIPAYNEEKRLPDALDRILAWNQTAPFAVEILVVENGSSDRTTEIAESYASRFTNIRVLHSGKGKGAAVRVGMLAGLGDYLFICDSDLSMPIHEISKFLPPKIVGYDIVIGSREAPGSVRYNEPIGRHIMGRIFNWLVRVLAVPGFSDTQCGFKLFRRQAAHDLFTRQTLASWTFDVEILYLALQRGYKVTEVPIHWYFNGDSRVKPLQDTWRMFWDVVGIRVNQMQSPPEKSVKVSPQSFRVDQ